MHRSAHTLIHLAVGTAAGIALAVGMAAGIDLAEGIAAGIDLAVHLCSCGQQHIYPISHCTLNPKPQAQQLFGPRPGSTE